MNPPASLSREEVKTCQTTRATRIGGGGRLGDAVSVMFAEFAASLGAADCSVHQPGQSAASTIAPRHAGIRP